MAVYYVDTSALVKCYVQEPGSLWMMELTSLSAGNDIYVSRITGPELIAALFRKSRIHELTLGDALRAAENFRADLSSQYRVIEITETVSDRAMTLAQRHSLRGYDAVQLAGALELASVRHELGLTRLTFICADVALNEVGESEGVPTDDPNSHE